MPERYARANIRVLVLQALTEQHRNGAFQPSALRLRGGGNPKVFFDVTIGGASAGRVTMELYADLVRERKLWACLYLGAYI
jgi:hypothetical protein